MGIILFSLVAGRLPYDEDKKIKTFSLHSLLRNDIPKFWDAQSLLRGDSNIKYSQDFRHLFLSMVQEKPSDRPTLDEIRESKFFQGPVYTQQELSNVMLGMIRKAC